MPAHLRLPVFLTHAGLVAERVVRAFWPLWVVVALVLVPVLMGWLPLMAVEAFWFYAVGSVVGLLGAAIRGWLAFRWPSRSEALVRVDAALPGRPIAAIADRQAIGSGDAASEAVWRAHLARMEARTQQARAVEPDLRLSARDPYGLRYSALLFLLVAVLFGTLWRAAEVDVIGQGDGEAIAVAGPVWEGWITPPSYTGRPALYLADIPAGALSLPVGSVVTLRLYGDAGALRVEETVSGRTGEIPPATEPLQTFTMTRDGRLEVVGEGGALWRISVIPDLAPEIGAIGPVEADAMGQMAQPFRASDDFGVVSGTATIALDLAAVARLHGLATVPDPRDPIVIDLPLPFSGDRTDFEERLVEDFSEHPFANLPVTLTLEAQDAAGQTGTGAPEAMVLPGRRFFQPMARAVIEQRRDLLWSRDNARRVLMVLRAVSHRPEDIFTNETTYLRLNVTLRRLEALSRDGMSDEEQDEIAQALWDLAIQLEDGTLADARERLRRAQERLSEAMRNGASDAEIAELMQELREATDDYLSMLAQNAEPREGGPDEPSTAQQDSMRVTQDEIQALMDRIQELMEEGRMAEAAELMEQLNQLMENLRVTEGDGTGNGPRTPGQQSMQELQDTLREQQDLSDQAFRDLQEQFNPGQQQGQQPGQQGQQPGQQPGQDQPGQSGQGQGVGDEGEAGQQDGRGEGGEGEQDGSGGEEGSDTPGSLADRQQALRQELDRQRGNLPGMTGEEAEAARRALERAEGAMDGAEEALRDNDLARAIDRQAEAMEALREGLRSLGRALAQNETQQQGEGQQTGDATSRIEPMRRDPLGRQLGNSGQYGTDENMLGGADIQRRAEELLGEIRRRAGELERPEDERDYLRRLLDRF